jgi:cytochrome b pre-mRNA-processing protein 3
MLDAFKTRTEMRRKAGGIYGAIVAQARQREFYADLGVPDTPSGRYEMVVLHLFLVLERLRAASDSALPRLLVEAFVSDMDDSLRELATGDLAVPKKVRRAAAGLYERTMDYRTALTAGDVPALEAALAGHILGTVNTDARSRALAHYVQGNWVALADIDSADIADGRFSFLPLASLDTESE